MKVAKPLGAFSPFGASYIAGGDGSSPLGTRGSHYQLLISPDGTEEELYFHGKTAIYSAGNQIKKAFTLEVPLQQVLWSSFANDQTRDLCLVHKETIQMHHSVMLLIFFGFFLMLPSSSCSSPFSSSSFFFLSSKQTKGIEMYMGNSRGTSSVAFPCRVARVWAIPRVTKNHIDRDPNQKGLLIERDNLDEAHESSPFLLSLLHPLEDFRPVGVVASNSQASSASSSTPLSSGAASSTPSTTTSLSAHERIVFSSTDLPLLVTYHRVQSQIGVWLIRERRVTAETEPSSTVGSIGALLLPQLYLQLLHRDQNPIRSTPNVFTSVDTDGSKLLCVLCTSESALRLYKLNVESRSIVTVGQISAIAAVPLQSSANRNATSSLLVLQPNSVPALYLGKQKLWDCKITLPNNNSNLKCVAFADAVLDRFNVIASDGSAFRFEIPVAPVTKRVSDCVDVLSIVLNGPLFLSFLSDLVAQESISSSAESLTAATELGSDLEWNTFVSVLCNLMADAFPAKQSDEKVKSDSSDWDFLLRSDYHHSYGVRSIPLPLPAPPSPSSVMPNFPRPGSYSTPAKSIAANAVAVIRGLHLLYEEYKLHQLTSTSHLRPLARVLIHLSSLAGMRSYAEYFMREFPNLASVSVTAQTLNVSEPPSNNALAFLEPPSIYRWLSNCFSGSTDDVFPMLHGSRSPCTLTRKICRLFATLRGKATMEYEPRNALSTNTSSEVSDSQADSLPVLYPPSHSAQTSTRASGSLSSDHRVVLLMVEEGISLRDVDAFPVGVAIPIREALRSARYHPPGDWPLEAYVLVGREDLAQTAEELTYATLPKPIAADISQSSSSISPLAAAGTVPQQLPSPAQNSSTAPLDGTELLNPVSAMIFRADMRVDEAQRLLRSSRVLTVDVKSSGGTEADILKDSQAKLLLLAQRTLASGVGRGAMVLSDHTPLPREIPLTDLLRIPPIVLNGKMKPGNTAISLETVPPEMLMWPEFHNGVASALRIGDDQHIVDTWILSNKPVDLNSQFAGMLLALGLNKHLGCLLQSESKASPLLYDLLHKGHELSSVALLIGLCASKAGSMHLAVSKVLSVHLSSLYPIASAEIDLLREMPLIQIAALAGLGLLYMKTSQRRMTEVLLSEINRKPNEATDRKLQRESYALAAGFALGLVTLGRGTDAVGLADLRIEERLSTYIHGSAEDDSPLSSGFPSTSSHSSSPSTIANRSTLVLEHTRVNTDVTAPAATVALSLMFLKSNNNSIANRLSVPHTPYLLDAVQPDTLILRVLCRSLILWDSIVASEEWINSQVPSFISKAMSSNAQNSANLDLQQIRHSFWSILCGACMAIGFRNAGSRDEKVCDLLIRFVEKLLPSKKVNPDQDPAERLLLERCAALVSASASVVMAGTGNLSLLRLLRKLNKRVHPTQTYGNHMMVSMAIGFLFLGGGRFSFGTSNQAIAGLLISLYPRLPLTSSDNRYHLQALRWLFSLSVERRCFVTRDIDTKQLCYIPLEVVMRRGRTGETVALKAQAPCLLPEFDSIVSIRVDSERYMPRTLDVRNNSAHMAQLQSKRAIFVKRKIGFLSHLADPAGHKSLLASSSTMDVRKNKGEFLKSFAADSNLIVFANHFCNGDDKDAHFYTEMLYECLSREKAEAISTNMYLYHLIAQLDRSRDVSLLQNFNLIFEYYQHSKIESSSSIQLEKSSRNPSIQDSLIDYNSLILLKTKLDENFSQKDVSNQLQRFISGASTLSSLEFPLNASLIYFDVPSRQNLVRLRNLIHSPSSTAAILPLLATTDACRKMRYATLALLARFLFVRK